MSDIIKKGQIIILSGEEYSDYHITHVVKALRDISENDLEREAEKFKDRDYKVFSNFTNHLKDIGWISDDKEDAKELWLGSYSSLSPRIGDI